MSPSTPDVVVEEVRYLKRTRAILEENPEGPGRSEEDLVRELIRLRDDYREAKTEDRGSIQEQLNQLMALLDQHRAARTTASIDIDNPYFAHLEIEEEGQHRHVFLGRATRLNHGLRIVDWRNAPISKLFYQYDQDDEFAEEMGGRIREGCIKARRTLHVAGGSILRIGTPTEDWVRDEGGWRSVSRDTMRLAGGEGAALRAGGPGARLGAGQAHRADKHLPDIAALIDPDQFALITAKNSGVVVLRGSAGSGKTTVALHRIAYLAYENRRFNPARVLVIVWGRAMRDYVAHVLPALGVEGVQVTTWTAWARKCVMEQMPELPKVIADDTPAAVSRLKLHAGTAQLLERHIRRTKGPRTAAQVVDDWAHVITNRRALARAVGSQFGSLSLEKAVEWNTQLTSDVAAWMDGDRKVDVRLDPEDDALLLRAWQLRCGRLGPKGRSLAYQHIVLDEVQDFSPVEVQVLLDTTDKNRSVTLAGDTRQHISKEAGFSSWQDFLHRIGVESTALSTLEISYRSTHSITRFAVDVLGKTDEPTPHTRREGPPVELFRFGDHGACVAFLAEELRQLQRQEPNANVAILTPTHSLSSLYADGLQHADLRDVRRVMNQQFAFAPGIDVVEVTEVKGLEFDYVVVVEASAQHWPDTEHHRRLLHVASTRAIHQLWLTSTGTPTSILPTAVR
jgi:DNA helicase-2/ATP-dependent DNA helicase PcrA